MKWIITLILLLFLINISCKGQRIFNNKNANMKTKSIEWITKNTLEDTSKLTLKQLLSSNDSFFKTLASSSNTSKEQNLILKEFKDIYDDHRYTICVSKENKNIYYFFFNEKLQIIKIYNNGKLINT